MKPMAVLGFLASLFGWGCKPASQSPAKLPAEAMRELRMKMLTTAASEFGISQDKTPSRVYGVVLDWPLDDLVITVVSVSDGNASLYTTSTFGAIGGVGHESVRTAARRFVSVAEKYYADAISTSEYPYPKPGHVRIYLTCFDGVRVIDADLDSLQSGKDKYSDLWAEGQNVVTELRLIAEKADGER